MWECPPFKTCPKCDREQGFGILGIESDYYERRCKFCGAKAAYSLPQVDKKVLYLDQFAISEIFKVKTRQRRTDAPHAKFWSETNELIDRAILYQQIICPASNIHLNETIVYHDGNALSIAHEMLGGDTSFVNATKIERRQICRHLEAYLKGEDPPAFDFHVDEIIDGHRNAWLPQLHITVETDWTVFAESIRLSRSRAAEDFLPLYNQWAREKPSFEDVLKKELDLSTALVGAYRHFMAMAQEGEASGDDQKFINGAMSPIVSLIHEINRLFVTRGTPPELAFQETVKFLNWPKNKSLPHHWISAHLYAAIANRFARGQKRHPSPGMSNDIRAISTYGPYVDAMFVDNECASLMEERSFAKGVKLKSKIFCLRRSADFLAYLRGLIDTTPQDVIDAAQGLYGVD